MKQLLNTLYITSEDIYLSLDGENVVANRDKIVVARYPLHTLFGIVSFSYAGASPALMGACAKRGIAFTFCNQNGRFLARINGETSGNVLLRRMQYRIADNTQRSCDIARMIIFGKLHNSRWSIERTCRDHGSRVDLVKLKATSAKLKALMPLAAEETSMASLRGIEGKGASEYFGVIDEMILSNKNDFFFEKRSRRPPLDMLNASLSFAYSLLTSDYASALESVGLDSYVGFLHTDRPGRKSLALDMMEELRPTIADRFVLTLINNRIITCDDFELRESGAVLFTDKGRQTFLKHWQEKKQEVLTHPYLGEKLPWGMVPYIQSMLLTRYLRGDLDAYPPFLWK